MPPVSRAHDAARCSCATFVAAYVFRGSSRASSVTRPGVSGAAHTGQGGSNCLRRNDSAVRGAGGTTPWVAQV